MHNMSNKKPEILALLGATGIGKTDIAIEIANITNGEIISSDARQFYNYMTIGTAKPTKEQLASAKHHFIDFLGPDKYYSAGAFAKDALKVIENLTAQNKRIIIAGGSGFYLRALVDGLFEEPAKDENVKKALQKKAEVTGPEPLYRKLQNVDPESAEKIMPNDTQRIIRALEVLEVTGKTLSWYHKKKTKALDYPGRIIGLYRPREELYSRINLRVDIMLKQGLVEEVKKLLEMGYTPGMNALKTVGYIEVFDYLENRTGYEEMVELIKQHTRNYAKRQITWFRKETRIFWYRIQKNEDHRLAAEKINQFWLSRKNQKTSAEEFLSGYPQR